MQITVGMFIGAIAATAALLLVLRKMLHDAYWAGYDQCEEDIILTADTLDECQMKKVDVRGEEVDDG